MKDSLDRLFADVVAVRDADRNVSRTSRLFQAGVQKMAKKLAEEAVEVGLEAVQMQSDKVILESADLLYHLCVLWAACDVTPEAVLAEITRRERAFGIAEKLPKAGKLSAVRSDAERFR
ncbi:phosphoribosyl-ATP diphosphatase [Methylovirgula sp. HY1]|uniref:phosphoribosyl-ATP diphosphatase n=1 Tax=Methylovirgula sp. HY1 TaxID=2822761 RepID=UPI001C5BEA65|nr:phosphoribosyl-ATP diphosphatase [Methylovirgula sp. HY1]QXX74959.1 Phosphoribosyl-ATP pyrophosphatase [Methylovirgula sp. HY1]